MNEDLKKYIARLQNLSAFNIHHPSPDGNNVVPWYEVTQQIAYELVVDDLNIPAQVDQIPVQLQLWGRYKSIAQRSLEILERQYAKWKAKFILDTIEKEEKKPSEATLEKMYRVVPEYDVINRRLEQAREAVNATAVIYDAFKAKQDVLVAYAPMYRDMAGRR